MNIVCRTEGNETICEREEEIRARKLKEEIISEILTRLENNYVVEFTITVANQTVKVQAKLKKVTS